MQDIKNLPNAVEIPNNNNTRHFGGYAAKNGRTVIREKLIRSGVTTGFQDEDKQILLNDYNMKRVIDFRVSVEIESTPPADIPGTEYIHMPLGEVEESSEGSTKLTALGAVTKDTHEIIQLFRYMGGTIEGIKAYFQDVSYGIISSAFGQNAFSRFFETLLVDDGGCTLFHCAGGKDRTGMAAILLLNALGVDWAQCIDDYLLTNEFSADIIEQTMKEIMKETDDPLVLKGCRLIMGVDVSFLEKAINYMTNEFGSVDRYLTDALNLTEDKRDKLLEIYTQ